MNASSTTSRSIAVLATTLLVVVASSRDAHAEPVRFTLDAKNESETWTSNVVATTRLALHGMDTVMGPLEKSDPRGLAETIGRISTFTLFELPILSYALVIPHEVFGHGSRYREFGGDASVSLDAPFPYSFEADHSVSARPGRSLYDGERILAHVGGLHAQERASHGVALGTVRAGYFRRSDSLVYSIFALTHGAQVLFGSDLRAASRIAGAQYGGDEDDYRTAHAASLVADVIDPYLWIALFGSLVSYGARGDRAFVPPRVRVAGFDTHLRTHSFVYPWGPGYVAHLMARRPEAALDLSIDVGAGPTRSSLATTVHVADVRLGGPLYLGVEGALWSQPPVSSVAYFGPLPTGGFIGLPGGFGQPRGDGKGPSFVGGAARITFEARVGHFLVGVRAGAKSEGVWGERPIAAGADAALLVGYDLAPPSLGP